MEIVIAAGLLLRVEVIHKAGVPIITVSGDWMETLEHIAVPPDMVGDVLMEWWSPFPTNPFARLGVIIHTHGHLGTRVTRPYMSAGPGYLDVIVRVYKQTQVANKTPTSLVLWEEQVNVKVEKAEWLIAAFREVKEDGC